MAFALVAHRIDALGSLVGGAKTSGTFDSTGATLLVVGILFPVSNNGPIITDSKGNTWHELIEASDGMGAGDTQWWYAWNPTVGSGHTVTITGQLSLATKSSVVIAAFSGARSAVDPFDVQNSATTNGGNGPVSPGSITPAEPNELVLSVCEWESSGGTVSIGSGFTITDQIDVGASNYGTALAYKIQTSAGAENPSWSSSVAQAEMQAVVASFKVAASAGVLSTAGAGASAWVAATIGRSFYVGNGTFGPTGNDSNPGTLAAPWLTIAHGLSQLIPGDTLYIRGGTYLETIFEVAFGTTGTNYSTGLITITGYPGELVTLQPVATGNTARFQDGSIHHALLQDLTLDAVNMGGGVGASILFTATASHDIHCNRVELKNSDDSGALLAGTTHEFRAMNVHHNGFNPNTPGANGMYCVFDSSTIIGGTFHHNLCYGIRVWDSAHTGGGHKATGNTIDGVTCYENGGSRAGVGQACPSIGGAITLGDVNNVCMNSVFHHNSNGIEDNFGQGSGCQYLNCTIYGNDSAVHLTGTNTVFRNNIVFGNTGGDTVTDNGTGTVSDHNLFTNPSFVNASLFDFHLQPGSVAIDAGATIALVTHDFDGNTRPQGPAYDIGAFEATPSTGAVSVTGAGLSTWTGAPLTNATATVTATGTATFVGASLGAIFFPPPLQPPYVFRPGVGMRYRANILGLIPAVVTSGAGALTATGAGAFTPVGATTTAGVLTASGAGAFNAGPVANGVWSASGAAGSAISGLSQFQAVLSTAGSGVSVAFATATAAVFQSAGTGAFTVTGMPTGNAVLVAAGTGTLAAVRTVVTNGVFSASGVGALTSLSTSAGVFSASGVGALTSVGVGPRTSVPSGVFSFISRASGTPVSLLTPTRYLSAVQAHTAGNLLIAIISRSGAAGHPIDSLSNSAGDTWVKTISTPYTTVEGGHAHEIWYTPSTNGHPADIITLFSGAQTDLTITIYEFALGAPNGRGLYLVDSANSVALDSGTNLITTLSIPVTQPSMLVAGYRTSNGSTPINPSGVQANAPNLIGGTTFYDSYQFTAVPTTVHAQSLPPPFDQWSIMAAAFTVIGSGCSQDLPPIAGGSGIGCSSNVP
jgi:hypothetical protein